MQFTTRPDIRGSFGAVAASHYLAAATGMGVLERGGNAFDAAVAAGFVLQVVEPHLNGPGGEMPAIVHDAGTGRIHVVCGQGVAPAGASIAHYRSLGLSMVPGSGLLAAVVPGAFDAWMLMLETWGSWRVEEVLEPAIHYAKAGHPALPRTAAVIDRLAPFFAEHWPSSAAIWCPDGRGPAPHGRLCNPALAATWTRIAAEARAAGSRSAGIAAARRAWSQGFVAEAVGRFLDEAEVIDDTGRAHRGVLRADDMARWQAHIEAPVTGSFRDWQICKTGPWGQGPVLPMALAMLAHAGIADCDPDSADFVHLVCEALKLALADRDAQFGDPDHVTVPLETLLSDAHARRRAQEIGTLASHDCRPSRLPGFEDRARAAIARAAARIDRDGQAGAAEPTMAHLARRGDTVHLDVIDRWGNMVSATPSGGWLQSSPAIPTLGFCLNTRAQMFRLEPDQPASLGPGRRPRTTLSPTLACRDGRPTLVCGTPGGDSQDQWQLVLILRHALFGQGLQAAIDAPLFHTAHAENSFAPRTHRPGHLMIEETAGPDVIAALQARGHAIEVAPAWSMGRLTAARRDADGTITAAATPRLMQAYAIGR